MNENIPKSDEELEERSVKPDCGATIYWLLIWAAAAITVTSICTMIMWMLVAWKALQ